MNAPAIRRTTADTETVFTALKQPLFVGSGLSSPEPLKDSPELADPSEPEGSSLSEGFSDSLSPEDSAGVSPFVTVTLIAYDSHLLPAATAFMSVFVFSLV